jgi:hypothetical protein
MIAHRHVPYRERRHGQNRISWWGQANKEESMLRATLAVAAYGLPGAPPLPEAPLPADSWNDLLNQVRAHRLTGLLACAVLNGGFPVEDWQRQQAMTADLEACAYVFILERRLLGVGDLFQRGDVEFRVLKGAALARLIYPNRRMRPFGDLDLLIPAAQFQHAIRLLVADAGCVSPLRERSPTSEFGKGIKLYTSTDESIDLHHRLDDGPFGQLIEPNDLLTTVDQFAIGQQWLPTLAAEERFVHACLHARLGDFPARLLSVRDVAQCVTVGDLSWRRIEDLCRQWQIGCVVGSACARARLLLGVPLPPEALRLAEQPPSQRDDRLLRAYEAAQHDFTALPLATLSVLPQLGTKLRYLKTLLLPRRDYLLGRYPNHRVRWRRAARSLAASTRQRHSG